MPNGTPRSLGMPHFSQEGVTVSSSFEDSWYISRKRDDIKSANFRCLETQGGSKISSRALYLGLTCVVFIRALPDASVEFTAQGESVWLTCGFQTRARMHMHTNADSCLSACLILKLCIIAAHA